MLKKIFKKNQEIFPKCNYHGVRGFDLWQTPPVPIHPLTLKSLSNNYFFIVGRKEWKSKLNFEDEPQNLRNSKSYINQFHNLP